MATNVTLMVPAHSDIVDDGFCRDFPELSFRKVASVEALAAAMADTEILITNTSAFYRADVAAAVNANCGKLKWIQFTTSGVDMEARRNLPPGVRITNARGLRADILAAHAMALMLGVMRGFRQFEDYRERTEWAREPMCDVVQGPAGRTMVIAGLSATGHEVARKAKAFSMGVIGVSRRGQANEFIDRVVGRDRFLEVLALADVVMLTMTLDDDTHHFLDAKGFKAMKPTAIVINPARGPLIDEAAMIAALEEGRIFGAGLDVAETEPLPPESPLWRMKNVLISPHIGGHGDLAQKQRLTEIVGGNLRRYLDGRELDNIVELGENGGTG